MEKGVNREKISPHWATKKGRHPHWNTSDESRRHWSKIFYIDGEKAGKRVQKKRKKFTRDTIRQEEIL